jgi:glycosyltransferase involved in cell wall biosynthesis
LTTSYPRFAGDPAGRFVEDAVERLRERGVEIRVVSPAAPAARPRRRTSGGAPGEPGGSTGGDSFRHFGIAYGDGVVQNLRRSPWKLALLPLMLAAFARAARRAARDADLVHAHWLPAGAVALATRKPVVVTLHGTDVELARRLPRLARLVLRRARVVLAVSTALAAEARALGAERVRVIPNGVDLPGVEGEEAEPPYVLFAGRLSPEKGILELVEAANGLPLVVAGDGPLRGRVPDARGAIPRAELEQLLAGAAVVAVPSRREGFGVVCAEAMAHGKPVVASAVGGLLDLVRDGETGLLVPAGDVPALRAALERLLADRELRRRLGAAARERARELLAWDAVVDATLAAYRDALF